MVGIHAVLTQHRGSNTPQRIAVLNKQTHSGSKLSLRILEGMDLIKNRNQLTRRHINLTKDTVIRLAMSMLAVNNIIAIQKLQNVSTTRNLLDEVIQRNGRQMSMSRSILRPDPLVISILRRENQKTIC